MVSFFLTGSLQGRFVCSEPCYIRQHFIFYSVITLLVPGNFSQIIILAWEAFVHSWWTVLCYGCFYPVAQSVCYLVCYWSPVLQLCKCCFPFPWTTWAQLFAAWMKSWEECSPLHLLLPVQWGWRAESQLFSPAPCLTPAAQGASLTISSGFSWTTSSALSYRTFCVTQQPLQCLLPNLMCILLLLSCCSLCFLLFLLPSSSSSSFSNIVSHISTVLSLFLFYVDFFFCICVGFFFLFLYIFMLFLHKKRDLFHSSPISDSWKWAGDTAESIGIAPVWLYTGRGLGLCCCVDFPEVILEPVQQFTVKGLQF